MTSEMIQNLLTQYTSLSSRFEQTQTFDEEPNPEQHAWAFLNMELSQIKTNLFENPRPDNSSFTLWALQHRGELLYSLTHSFIHLASTYWPKSRPLSLWDLYSGEYDREWVGEQINRQDDFSSIRWKFNPSSLLIRCVKLIMFLNLYDIFISEMLIKQQLFWTFCED